MEDNQIDYKLNKHLSPTIKEPGPSSQQNVNINAKVETEKNTLLEDGKTRFYYGKTNSETFALILYIIHTMILPISVMGISAYYFELKYPKYLYMVAYVIIYFILRYLFKKEKTRTAISFVFSLIDTKIMGMIIIAIIQATMLKDSTMTAAQLMFQIPVYIFSFIISSSLNIRFTMGETMRDF